MAKSKPKPKPKAKPAKRTRWARWRRMHVVLEGRRTTTSMDNTLATLLSIKLGHTEFDIAVVRQWCQEAIDADPGAFIGGALGSRLSHQALLEVATPKLVEAFYRET